MNNFFAELKAAQRLLGRSSLRGGVVAFDSAASILLKASASCFPDSLQSFRLLVS
jgi:hypothetical protein